MPLIPDVFKRKKREESDKTPEEIALERELAATRESNRQTREAIDRAVAASLALQRGEDVDVADLNAADPTPPPDPDKPAKSTRKERVAKKRAEREKREEAERQERERIAREKEKPKTPEEMEVDLAREEYFRLKKLPGNKAGRMLDVAAADDLPRAEAAYTAAKKRVVESILNSGTPDAKARVREFYSREAELKKENEINNGTTAKKVLEGVKSSITWFENIGNNPEDKRLVRFAKKTGKMAASVAMIGGASVAVVAGGAALGVGSATAISGGVVSYLGRRVASSVVLGNAISALPPSLRAAATPAMLGISYFSSPIGGAVFAAGALGYGASKVAGLATQRWFSEEAIAKKRNELGNKEIDLDNLADLEAEYEKIAKEAERKRTWRRLLAGATALSVGVFSLEYIGYAEDAAKGDIELKGKGDIDLKKEAAPARPSTTTAREASSTTTTSAPPTTSSAPTTTTIPEAPHVTPPSPAPAHEGTTSTPSTTTSVPAEAPHVTPPPAHPPETSTPPTTTTTAPEVSHATPPAPTTTTAPEVSHGSPPTPPSHESPPVSHEAPTAPHASEFKGVEVAFNKEGEGGTQGILDLKNQIRHDYPDLSKAPQTVQDFMKGTNATEQSIKLGFLNLDGSNGPESALIGQGSTLGFDNDGNLIFHNTAGGADHFLIHAEPDPTGSIPQVERYEGDMMDRSGEIHHAETGETPPHPETPAAHPLSPAEQDLQHAQADLAKSQADLENAKRAALQAQAMREETDRQSAIDRARMEEELHHWQEMRRAAGIGSESRANTTPPIPPSHTSLEEMKIKAKLDEQYVSAEKAPNTSEPSKVSATEHAHTSEKPQTSSIYDRAILQGHPEYAENLFNLSDGRLMDAYHMGQQMIDRIFPGNEISKWYSLSHHKATEIFDKTALGRSEIMKDSPYGHMFSYLQKLRETTGLEPQGWSLLHWKSESLEHYIARAMQWAVANDKVGDVNYIKR